MAILGCWGEDVDLVVKSPGFNTDTGLGYRGVYSRCSLTHRNSTVDSLARAIASPVTSAWLSMRLMAATTAGYRLVGLGRAGYNGGIWVTMNTSAGKLAVAKVDEAGTETVLASESGTSFIASTLQKIDLRIDSFGAAGQVRLYFNSASTPVVDYSGDLTWSSGPTNLDQVRLRNAHTSSTAYASELILADEDTRTMSLVTLAPNAAGAGNTFTSGTYADVDESAASEADVMSSNTTAQHAELALSNLPTGTFTVKAVKVAVRALRGATGPQQLKIGIRDNTAGINVDAGRTLDVVWADYERFMTTNPATSNPWAQAEIDVLQFAMESLT